MNSTIKVKRTKKITRNTKINYIVENYPEVVTMLMYEWNFHCINCFYASFDTLKQGAFIHGIKGKDFQILLKMCNDLVIT